MEPGRLLLRAALTALHRLRRIVWKLRGSRAPGVLAVPLTPERRLILVRLTYTSGWRLPGGGRRKGEPPREAVLRELGEEIGMSAHGAVTCLDGEGGETLFLVEDVRYAPRRSFEIEEVAEFDPAALPPGLAPVTRRRLDEALPLLRRA